MADDDDGSLAGTRDRTWRKYALDEEIGAGAILLADASLENVPHFRETWRRISMDASVATPAAVEHTIITIPAAHGNVVAHRYGPRSSREDAPAILLLHGGAFVGGAVASVHTQACNLVVALGVVRSPSSIG